MLSHRMVLLSIALAATTGRPRLAPAAAAVPTGAGTVVFVDGVKTECDILFKHPNCDRLIVRSCGGSTVQSLDLAAVHQVSAGGASVTVHPRRALTDGEKARREANRL